MHTAGQVPLAPVTVAGNLAFSDLSAALAAGLRDFRARPVYGLFFAAVYVAAGLALSWAVLARGQPQWLVLAIAGFPIVGPFTAVGLYEVSRRLQAGEPISWRPVLTAVRARGDDQILMIGFILFVAFIFWLFLAHGIAAIFLSTAPIGASGADLYLRGPGLPMLLVGSAVGALFAFALFALTVLSLPMLVDRKVDFMTAIIVSLGTVRSNAGVMLAWALTIAMLLLLAMLPAFLGLFLVLPMLGHASWHLYRRAVPAAG